MARFYRFCTFDRTQLNESERSVPVAFSSEHPVDRGDYDEVLDHSDGNVDLTRMGDAPVLLNHDPDKQIGVVMDALLSSSDKRCRCMLRFSRGQLGEEIYNDVKDGIRKQISVGYERTKTVASQKDAAGRNLIRFAWRALEVSVVPVGADPNAGVGRSAPALTTSVKAGNAGSPPANRTITMEDCGWLCSAALSACNDAIGEIEECDSAKDEAHSKASELARDAISALAITKEDVQFWSEATAADCVAVCAECATTCDAAVVALRAVCSCAHCGSECTEAIEELQEACEACRENAGMPVENAGVAAEAKVEAGTGIETRSSKVDGKDLPNANAQPRNGSNSAAPTTILSVSMSEPATPPVIDPKLTEAARAGGAEGERARIKAIRAGADFIITQHYTELPEAAAKIRTLADEAIEKVTKLEDFNAELLRSMPGVKTAKMVVPTGRAVGLSERDLNEYSVMRAIQSVLKKYQNGGGNVPDGLEGETHRALDKMIKEGGSGVSAAGFWIPSDIGVRATPEKMSKRDLNVTAFGQGGAFVQTSILTPIIEIYRNKMVTPRLGVQTMAGLEGNVAIPRQTGAATAYSLPESASLTKSTQAIDQVLLTPKRVGAYNDYTKQLLLQSSVDVENFIRDDLMKVVAIKWDKLVLEGSGSSSEPTGILNTTGIGSVHFGATPTLAKIVSFETALALANADIGRMAYVTTPSVRATLKVTPKVGTTFPIFIWEEGDFADGSNDGEVNSYRAAVTNQIANNAVAFGNFEDCIQALFGGFDVVVNPYSRDIDAVVRITVNTFGDVAVRHAASFAWSDDAGNQ